MLNVFRAHIVDTSGDEGNRRQENLQFADNWVGNYMAGKLPHPSSSPSHNPQCLCGSEPYDTRSTRDKWGMRYPLIIPYPAWSHRWMVFPGGRERSEKEWRSLFAQGGFTITKIVPTHAPESVIEAVVS